MWRDEEEEYEIRRFKAPHPIYNDNGYKFNKPVKLSREKEPTLERYNRPNPVIIPIERDSNTDDSDGGGTDYYDSGQEEEITGGKDGNLDRWDRASRIWLSSGTVFLLILLLHLVQVRNEIRLFISDTSIRINQECTDMDKKFINLGEALVSASSDVGPISLKFVRDLKLKIRNTFQFAAQIFGGKIRELMFFIFGQYYCIFIGVVLAIQSILNQILTSLIGLDQETFISGLLEQIQGFLSGITKILLNPEEAILEIFEHLQTMAFQGLQVVEIPVAEIGGAQFCAEAQKINFVEVDHVLRNYMKLVILGLAVILIFYNSYKYLAFLEETDQIERKLITEIKKARGEDTGDQSIFVQMFYCWIPLASIRRLIKWFCQFMSYQPFWVFLSMGVLGMLHLNFSQSLQAKMDSLKKDVIEPVLDSLNKKFTDVMDQNLKIIELSWINTITETIQPIGDFIQDLKSILLPIFHVFQEISSKIEEAVTFVLKTLYSSCYTSSFGKGLHAMIDCFFLRQLRTIKQIGETIGSLFDKNDLFKPVRGGIIGIIKNMLGKLLLNFDILTSISAMLTRSIIQFLDSLNKRSYVLYIYFIICLILLFQGVLMALIKFFLGYF